MSKEYRTDYRRKLPHLQDGQRPIHISMSTHRRLHLPARARSLALECVLRERDTRVFLHVAVVMPDHCHLLFSPRLDEHGRPFALAAIMNGIRGPSAHRINKLLGRRGPVWEEEYFDRVLRFGEFEKTVTYICENPVKAGLVLFEEDYQWLWVNPLV